MTQQEHIGSVAMGDGRVTEPMVEAAQTALGHEGVYVGASTIHRTLTASMSARPVQEPVAWVSENTIALLGSMSKGASNVQISNTPFKRWTVPLYASPQPAHGTSATERAFLPTEDGEFNGNELSDLAGLDVDKIAKAIVLAACELDEFPDPDDDDTLLITVQDLEAVAHRHITAALERAALSTPTPKEESK